MVPDQPKAFAVASNELRCSLDLLAFLKDVLLPNAGANRNIRRQQNRGIKGYWSHDGRRHGGNEWLSGGVFLVLSGASTKILIISNPRDFRSSQSLLP